jgi:LysM repeat protein
MNQNSDIESDQITLELTSDMLETPGSDKNLQSRNSRDAFTSFRLPIILASSVVLILIIVFMLWVRSHEKRTDVELNTLKLKINMLEGRLSHLEKETSELQSSVTKGMGSQGSLTQRLNTLSQQVNQLENQVSSSAVRISVPDSVQPSSVTPGKRRYHEVKPGETLYRIAMTYGLSVNELCRLNDISPEQVGNIQPGQRLLVFLEE